MRQFIFAIITLFFCHASFADYQFDPGEYKSGRSLQGQTANMDFAKKWFKGLRGTLTNGLDQPLFSEDEEIYRFFFEEKTRVHSITKRRRPHSWPVYIYDNPDKSQDIMILYGLHYLIGNEEGEVNFSIVSTKETTVFSIHEDEILWVFYYDRMPIDVLKAVIKAPVYVSGDYIRFISHVAFVNMSEVAPNSNLLTLRKRFDLKLSPYGQDYEGERY